MAGDEIAGSEETQEVDLAELTIRERVVELQAGKRRARVRLRVLGSRSKLRQITRDAWAREMARIKGDPETVASIREEITATPREALIDEAIALDRTEVTMQGLRDRFAEQADREIHDPVMPQRDQNETEAEFDARRAQNESELKAAKEARERRTEEIAAEARPKYADTTLAQFVEILLENRMTERAMGKASEVSNEHLLLMVCHKADDSGRPYFAGLEQVKKLPDAVRLKLIEDYATLDAGDGEAALPLESRIIPTSG